MLLLLYFLTILLMYNEDMVDFQKGCMREDRVKVTSIFGEF